MAGFVLPLLLRQRIVRPDEELVEVERVVAHVIDDLQPAQEPRLAGRILEALPLFDLLLQLRGERGDRGGALAALDLADDVCAHRLERAAEVGKAEPDLHGVSSRRCGR